VLLWLRRPRCQPVDAEDLAAQAELVDVAECSRTFGVVRQVEVAGDRRDYYVTEPDV
jgi:hypothetical protein